MNRLLCILSLCLLAFSPTLADNLTAEERESVEAEIQKRIEITAEKLEAPALKKVFDATFIKAEVKIESPDGSRSNFDMLLVKSGNRFVSPESATTNKEMPSLQGLIKADFRIRDKEDAKVLEEALDVIYPMSTFGRNKDAKALRQNGNTWTFVRGTFFDDLKGFVVTTDDEGKITAVRYSLKIKKQ